MKTKILKKNACIFSTCWWTSIVIIDTIDSFEKFEFEIFQSSKWKIRIRFLFLVIIFK